jgi:Ca-activated chloride channel family protein
MAARKASNHGLRMMFLVCLILVGAAAIWCWFVTPSVLAQPREQGLQPGDVTEGSLLLRGERQGPLLPAPVLHTDVEISITGLIARAKVQQRFRNPGAEWAEGIYVFPLPETAAVDHLRMRVGERIIEGVIKERAEAKKIYENAKGEGKRASLVEQERPNIFTTSVANIGPGEEIMVEIEYQETVRYDQGHFRLRFPMVVGPRYIPGTPEPTPNGHGWAPNTDAVPDASRITPPVLHPRHGTINPVTVKIELAPGFPVDRVESPYHKVSVKEQATGHYTINLADAAPANRDLELMWQPATGQAPSVTVFTEQEEHHVFALMMAMPPDSLAAQERLPRETIFIVDTSGSMYGPSIQQAKAALNLALSRLRAEDTFNVIEFNSITNALFTKAMSVTKETRNKAQWFVNNLQARGGTEMLPALQLALDGGDRPDRVRQVIFLTDGAVGNEDQLFSVIRQRLGDSRLFTVGIGSAPNSHFMRKAAEFGRGSFTFIGSTTEVQDKMEALFRKLEHPAFTDIRLEFPSGAGVHMIPDPIPDLYLGEPLVVAIKADKLPEQLTVTGQWGKSRWKKILTVEQATQENGISVHWARQKISSLMDQHGGIENEAVRQAVIDLAKKHHLVSRYTSLVAVDVTPARATDQMLNTHALKTNLPDGWDYTAVFGLPQTATTGTLQIMVGLLLLLASAGVCCIHRRQV